MDDIVRAAMAKWPNVPNVFGWLKLDARGNWKVKSVRHSAKHPVFERMGNRAVIDFINRNYEADGEGRWYFQNGPQRVFVILERAPLVARLHEDGRLASHCAPDGAMQAAQVLLDENAQPYFVTPQGLVALDDRDFELFAARLRNADGSAPEEDRLARLFTGDAPLGALRLALQPSLAVQRVLAASLAATYGFNPDPRPGAGVEDCY